MAYVLGTVISVLRFSRKLNKVHFHASPENQKEGIYVLKVSNSFRLSQVESSALANATIPSTTYRAAACVISAIFPMLSMDSRFSCFSVVMFPCHFILCKTQSQISDHLMGGWGPLVVFTSVPTTGISGDVNLSPLAEDSTSGISRLLCLLHGVSGMEWVGDLALSFKLILQQRFHMVHFLASLSAFQSTCCLYTISFSYFSA